MDNEKLSNLRQRWRRNGREIRGIVATLAVLVVALGTAVSLFLAAFTQTRPTYCGQKHEHTTACYSNPRADVETAKKWEKTLPAFEEETPRITKLVDVVRSQVGYSESKDNYAVEGDELRGYTRYGAWDGDPYEPWNATFVNFCLHYAGIDAGVFAPKSADESREDAKDAQDESGDAVEEDAAEDGANEEASQEQDLVLEQASTTEDYDVPQDDDPLAGADQDADPGEDTSWYADVQWDDEDQSTDDNAANNVADDTSWTDDVSWDDELQDTENGEDAANGEDAENSDDSGASDAGASDAGESQEDDDADKATEQQKAPRTAEEWKQRLSDAGLYVAASDAKPQAGDLVFLQEPTDEAAASKVSNKDSKGSEAKGKKSSEASDAKADQEIEISADDVAGVESDDKDKSQPENKPLRVAIVTDVNNKKGLVRIAEGDASDEVDETWYPASDPEIVGYGTMPSELRDELAAYKKLVAERKAAEEEAAKKAAEEEAARKAEEEAARKAAEEEAAKKAAAEEEAARKAAEEEAAKLEAELKEVPQVLTAEADGFRISANLAGQAQEGYTLQIKPLKATKKRLAAVEEGLTQELPDGATKQAHVDADDVVLFDISIRDKDGNEVELGKKVRITATPLEDANQQASAESAASDQTPEVVHLATEGTEVLNAKPKDEGFSFATKSLSPFAFVFTVDFEYQGYTWSMAGESSALLSTVLSELNVSDFTIDDVTDATFSNPKLVEVTEVAPAEPDGQRDWQLKSLKAFTTSETLTLTLADGSTVVIDVTDTADDDAMAKAYDDPQHIRRRLARVEFYDGNALVGDSENTSESMVVRPGHEYTMRLHFSENENLSGDAGQLPDSGIMYYDIPNNVHISPKVFDENYQVKFDITLDRKHTLADNVVTYVPANGNVPAYLKVEWNTADTENYKRLKASPRTTFMLSFPYTTVDAENVNEISFSETVKLNVEKDQTYDVELEKECVHDETDPSMITYTVTATALGDVKNVVLTDAMGEALTYQYDKAENASPGVSVTYKDSEGQNTSYEDSNIGAVTQSDRGFSLQLNSLKGGDKAIFTYRAKVDFAKLGGQDNIEITSRNTVTAKNQEGEELDQTYQVLEDIVNYLQIGKARGVDITYYDKDDQVLVNTTEKPHATADWAYMYVPWTVIYNPDGKIDVEGATITDKIWKGAKNVTTYDQTKPLTITAYSAVNYTKGDAGANDSFTLKDGCETVVLVDGTGEHNGWDALDEVTDYLDDAHLSTWSWTIPPKDGTDRKENNHYTYVITYYTKVLNDANRKSGYVGNQASENIADITRDKSVEFPGVGPDYDVEIDKKYLQDDYVTETVRDPDTGKTKTVTNVYTQWEVTFDRRVSGQDRALVEDTLPHTEINGVVYTDTFESAGYKETDDWNTHKHGNYSETTDQNGEVTSTNHGWQVTGLRDSEICIPRVSTDQYDVVFWFYTSYTGNKDDLNNREGLQASTIRTDENNNEQHDPITITFWTKNSNTWIQSTAEGRAPSEHWNYVHLILNGKEAIDKEFAIPKPTPEINKKQVEAGTWTKDGVTLPVYRYTLSLSGLSDEVFQKDDQDNPTQLVISDTFDATLDYIPVSSFTGTDGTEATVDGYEVKLNGRSNSDGCFYQASPVVTKAGDVSQWQATLTGGTDITQATQQDVTRMGKGNTKTLTITIPYAETMKKDVLDEEGHQLVIEGRPQKAYASTYEVSYYLALDQTGVQKVAQDMIDEEKRDPANFNYNSIATSRSLKNTAKVNSYDGQSILNEADWTFAYNLKPVQKQLLSYDSSSELATYKIEINPLKVKVNNGERYSVQDSYTNMAVDFQTVNIVTEPASARKDVEWSYHSNKGTFWVPDETKVTITYEGWPVGKRDNDDLTFSNTASIGGYEAEVKHDTKLDVEHSGYASSYRVRVFKFEDDNMDKTLPGAVFQLFEEGEDGEPVAMKYGVSSGVSEENNNNSFGAWNASDDSEWQSVTWEKANTAGILHYTTAKDQASEANSFIPTPERHYEGDNIYFITGNGGNENGKSEQSGFAEIMLSQSRDGLSLKKNKQYYLREVLVPDEHYKEDIDWRFIIGDADDYDNYVYADDSVMQVSNASVDRVLTVHKDFVDLTSGGKITNSKNNSIDYDLIKNTEFEIVGTDKEDDSKVVYRKVVPYSSFMAVYTPIEGSTKSKREYLLIIHDLPEGNYTVKELRTSGLIKDANGQLVDGIRLTTSVEDASATTTTVKKEGGQVLSTTNAFRTEYDGLNTNDSYFKFEVTKAEDTIAGTVTKTAAEATFTNIYTDEPPVTLSLTKEWSNGGKDGFTPKKAEFALYADGVKYNLTEYNGVSAPGSINSSGNIVLTVVDNAASPWTTTATITNLPMYQDGSIEHKIEWTVKEVSATYNMGGNTSDITVDVAQNDLLNEHFLVTAETGNPTSDHRYSFNFGDQSSEQGSATLTNTLNKLITVEVVKSWADGNNNHGNDSVFVDIYRVTKDTIAGQSNPNYQSLASDANRVIENYELNAANNWTFHNEMMERFDDNDNKEYQYFALERSVAGYTQSQARSDSTGQQQITITNTKHADARRGTLSIHKDVSGLPDGFSKTYKFTLWNSGKYMAEDGSLYADRQEISVEAGQTKTISNVKLGTYILEEVEDEARVGGYTLASTNVSAVVNGGTAVSTSGHTAEITVTDASADPNVTVASPQTTVTVANTYAQDQSSASKTKFTFGKLWAMPAADEDNPNAGDSTTLPWPNGITTTMQIRRRLANQESSNDSFVLTYEITKNAQGNIETAYKSGTFDGNPPELVVGTGDNVTSYSHYTFSLNGLPKYDTSGGEWVYYAQETAVVDAQSTNLLHANETGRQFVRSYGYVDGIGAYSVPNKQDAAANSARVEYAINRLKITDAINIPVQKSINGWTDWGSNASNKYPSFTFMLYDSLNRVVTDDEGNPVTFSSNDQGFAEFDATPYIDLNQLYWRKYNETVKQKDEATGEETSVTTLKQTITGTFTFSIKEVAQAAPNLLDALSPYQGITYFSGKATITFKIDYNWMEGKLVTTARVTNESSQPAGTEGKAVITNTYNPAKTQLTVTKTWDDANNQDGYRRPVKFKVNATYKQKDGNGYVDVPIDKVWTVGTGANGTKTQVPIDLDEYRITVNPGDGNTSSKTVTLPKYYEGHLVSYTAQEMRSEDATLSDKYNEVPAVAKIGSKYYPSLREAVDDASAGATIVLLADDDQSFATGGIIINKNLTINGNYHTVKGLTEYGIHNVTINASSPDEEFDGTGGSNAHGFFVQSGNVTIKNLNMTQFGDSDYVNKFGLVPVLTATNYNGTLKLENVDIDKFNRQAICIFGGTFQITGGTINGNGTNKDADKGKDHFQQGIEIRGGTGTVNGTTVRGMGSNLGYPGIGIVSWSTGTVTLKNVDVDVEGIGVEADYNTVAIDGNKTYVKATEKALFVEDAGTLNVTGGTYIGPIAVGTATTDAGSKINVSGGEFTQKVLDTQCATGYVPSEQLADGMWTVLQETQQTPVSQGSNQDVTVPVPTAVQSLVYNGQEQVGVASGEGYTLTGNTATNAGVYEATATLKTGYAWADANFNGKVSWSIGRAPATVKVNDVVITEGETNPTLTCTVTGTFGDDTLSYTAPTSSKTAAGTYTINASGDAVQGNYDVTYESGSFVILPNTPAEVGENAIAYIMAASGTVTSYNTVEDLVAAIAAASGDDCAVVHLLKNVTLDKPLHIDKKVIIDGASSTSGETYTIQPSENYTYRTEAPKELAFMEVSGTGDLIMSNVTIDAAQKHRAIRVSGGKLTLNSGAKVTNGTTATSYIGGVYMTGKSQLIMNGGEISGNTVPAYSADGYLQYTADLWIGSEAKGTMNGGKVVNLFVNSNAYAKPSAGFTQNGGEVTNAFIEYDRAEKASLTYTSGALTNLYISQDDASANSDKHSAVQPVTEPAAGTTYSAGSAVACIGSGTSAKYFTSFEAAVNDAHADETITLLASSTTSSMVSLNKSITVDLNGYTLSAASNTDKAFEVVGDAKLTINGTTANSAFVGRINVGKKSNNNGNLELNGGTYSCGSGQTVVHVNGTCKNSSVTIKNATITSPDDNGIQLNGDGTYVIEDSSISGATAVYLKAGKLTVAGSWITSTASSHTDYTYSSSGSNPTGDAIVVDSCHYPGGNPTLELGVGNQIAVSANSGNVQVGYYEYNTSQSGYAPGVVTATTSGGTAPDITLPVGYDWAKSGNETYAISETRTVTSIYAGSLSADGKAVESQDVVIGQKATKPSDPTRTDKTFLGWYYTDSNNDEVKFDFNTSITADITLTAKWEDIVTAPTSETQYTNVHVPETVNVSVTKAWVHNGKTEDLPTQMKVRLVAKYGNHKTVNEDTISQAQYAAWRSTAAGTTNYSSMFDEVTLTATDSWSKTWNNLPRFAPGEQGKQVTYTIEEVETVTVNEAKSTVSTIPIGYHQTDYVAGEQIEVANNPGTYSQSDTITNTYESVNIPIQKVWQDDDDRDSKRPQNITMALSAVAGKGTAEEESITIPSDEFVNSAGTQIAATQTLSGNENTWSNTTSWANLPAYYHGKPITYTVAEQSVPEGYEASGDPVGTAVVPEGDTNNTHSVTNTHAIERTTVSLTKTWRDNKDQDGKRPGIVAYANTFVHFYAELGGDETKTEFKMQEDEISGASGYHYLYVASDSEQTPYMVDGMNLKAHLVESSDGRDYVITYENLPKKKNTGSASVDIAYSVTETDDEGHVLQPGDTSTHKNLSTNSNNDTYLYHIYTAMSSAADDDGNASYAVTNEYEPDFIDVKAKKTWTFKDGLSDEEKVALGNQIQLKLVAKDGTTEIDTSTWANAQVYDHVYNVTPQQSLTRVDANTFEWQYTWQKLPKYVPGKKGQLVTYTVEEVASTIPDGYHMTATSVNTSSSPVERTKTGEVEVTNTYEDVTVSAKKTWYDANNQDGLRKTVKFQLQEQAVGDDGEYGDWTPVDVSNTDIVGVNPQTLDQQTTDITNSVTTATWSKLPAWKKNQRVNYRVVEIPADGTDSLGAYLPGYSQTNNPAVLTYPGTAASSSPNYTLGGDTDGVITNKHTPAIKNVTFVKKWDHKGASNILTTAQFKETLHLWARVGTTGDVYEIGDSSHWNPVFATDWKSDDNTTVTEDGNGNYVVTVMNLPVNKPKREATASEEPLEYYLTEAEVPTGTTGAADINTLLGYYTQTYPTGTDHPANTTGESTTQNAQTEYLQNTRQTGNLTINKVVESDLAGDNDIDFSFTVTASPAVTGEYAVRYTGRTEDLLTGNKLVFNDGTATQTIRLRNGQGITITGLPVGVTYTVTEAQETDFEIPQYQYSTDGGTTYTSYISNATNQPYACKMTTSGRSVRFKNIRKKNDLTISKTVHSAVQGDKSREFTFKVTLNDTSISKSYNTVKTAADNTTTTGSVAFTNGVATGIKLKHGERLKIEGLPVTVGYTVEEVFNDDETAKYTAVGPQTGKIGSSEASSVSFTNTRQTGTLKLTKKLLNAIPTDEGDTFYFNVRLRGDDVQSGQTEGQPLVLDANAPITVKSGNNSWTLNTTSNDHPYYDATEGIIRNVPVVWHAATQTSIAGGTTTIEGLPWGATYTVTEVSVNTPITGNPGNITKETRKTNDTGTIVDTSQSQNADANTASFQNTRKTGSLSINKHVVSPVTQEKASTCAYSVEVQLNTTHKVGGENKSVSEFTPTFTRTNGADYENPPAFDQDGKATITLHQDETVTISGIPTDVTYTVTEPNTNPEYFNKTYGIYDSDTNKYVDTTHQYASGGIPTNDTAKTQVINTRKLGDLVVSKAVNSAVASDKTHNYHFKVELTSPVSGQTLDAGKYTGDSGMEFRSGNDANTAEFDLCDQGRKTATGLPVGWTYTVTESASTGSGAADLSKFNTTWTKTVTANGSGTTTNEDNGSGYACPVSSASGGSGQTQTTYSIEEDTTSAIEFLNTRKTGQLQLTKTVRSPFGKEKDATYQFKVSLQMPANGGTPEPITYAFDATNCTGNTVQFSQGVATINVQGRQDRPIVISGLPIDAEYAVTEVVNNTDTFEIGAAQYNKIVSTSTTPVADDRASHVIEENVTYGAAVTNTRTKVPVSILKVSATYAGTKLEGAVFTLTAPDDSDLRTRLGWTTKQLVSDAQGYLCEDGGTKRFELLPSDGLYTLEEVKAPLGYHKLAQAATFKVTPDGVVYTDSIHPQNCVETNDSDTPANRVVHVNVANTTGAELPSTGGSGLTLVCVVGCVYVALAVAVVLLLKRNRGATSA